MPQAATARHGDRGWPDLFEDRYGAGAYERLTALLDQPCTTFAEIAAQFGVTRERVRQWHIRLRPDAPRGHERQHLCWLQQQKRALFDDPLFRSFYRHARAHFQARRLVLIPARDGFRKRTVKLDEQVIGLRHARPARGQRPSVRGETQAAYTLSGAGAPADFFYYRLTDHDYLFVPRQAVPPSGTTYIDGETAKYLPFRNTFRAALAPASEAAPRV
jgi:hypothetical protein